MGCASAQAAVLRRSIRSPGLDCRGIGGSSRRSQVASDSGCNPARPGRSAAPGPPRRPGRPAAPAARNRWGRGRCCKTSVSRAHTSGGRQVLDGWRNLVHRQCPAPPLGIGPPGEFRRVAAQQRRDRNSSRPAPQRSEGFTRRYQPASAEPGSAKPGFAEPDFAEHGSGEHGSAQANPTRKRSDDRLVPPSKAPPSIVPPGKVPTTPPKPQLPPPAPATVPAVEPSAPAAKVTSTSARPKQPTRSNSTTLILVSAAAIILVAAIFFFTRKHYAPPVAKTPRQLAPTASAPAVPVPQSRLRPSAPTAPAPTTPEPSPPASRVSSDTAAGKATLDDQPPAESGHNLGTLLVVAGQDDARVFLNGKLQRQLTQAGQLRLPNLELKDYVVQVSKSGFQDPPQQKIRIRKGEQASLSSTCNRSLAWPR